MATTTAFALSQGANLPLADLGACATPEGLWDHSRNSIGIARLLLHEGRPPALVATACRTAAEYACRAALRVAGQGFDDDLVCACERLEVPADLLWAMDAACSCRERLAATERLLDCAARKLRRMAPERRWTV